MKRFFKKVFNWELWPFDLMYAPLGVVWLYYSLKARSLYFFTPTNPGLPFGGFEVGSKMEMYSQLPAGTYPTTILIRPSYTVEQIKAELSANNLAYPFVAKPDEGMQGILFRVIDSEKELIKYHSIAGIDYILQTFVEFPMEFSVFYIRYPGETKGRVTGFVLKDYLQVTGDGKKTLEQLVNEHPRAQHRLAEMKKKHTDNWLSIPGDGENYHLSVAGNRSRGARFINLHTEIDQRLNDVFDRLNNASNGCYYGRYDLKCTSIEDLKNGKNISILEYNGAGAEPNHIYDCGMSYGKALSVIASHWRDMYRIAKINNRNGVRYWSFNEANRFRKQQKKDFAELKKKDLILGL
ncbi:MAG TPA: hypothetical protein VFP97_03630 [Chitinophagaceae bacterium]|nr:hypothetical protein [Chitinophagaceae bacterium]